MNATLLTEKYRPTKTADFLGLDKAKKLCANLIANPFESYFLFVGASGMGKTTLALALADELAAELHHIPSQNCTVDAIERVYSACQYVPMMGKNWHVILVDEADQMSNAAQLALLSMMDGTRKAPNTIIIYTCNETAKLQDRFLSRCIQVDFSTYGVAKDAAKLLEEVWGNEAPASALAPNFARLVKEANNNVRAALMSLQKEIMFA
jgi:replication-associated recombination protein RarA